MESPQYIKALLKPNGNKPTGRRVWSIDLESVWLPFFTATNTQGDTALAAEALGAPLRLAYDKDGTVKFSQTGRPVVRVVKEVADSVRLVRENFVAALGSYAHNVIGDNPDGYKAQVLAAQEAGRPIVERDKAALLDALLAGADALTEADAKAEAYAKIGADALAEAEAKAAADALAEAEPQAEPQAKPQAKPQAEAKPKARVKEAVAA